MQKIQIERTTAPKAKPADESKLGFGKIFTDHMYVMEYNPEQGWHDPKIMPYQPIVLDPSAMVFHYGQEMFEGMKAYKCADGRIRLFRPNKNIERANNSNRRLCIPEIPADDFLNAIKTLVAVDADWIPSRPGTSLYIRPFVIATDPFLGVRPSNTYKFIIILSPVGAYYESGLDPVKIWIEDDYVRAVRGGIGEAKTGGNYVASLAAQVKAHDEGYSQVLWLDGVERKYIEEVGAMNIFFKINGTVVTPMLNGSILPALPVHPASISASTGVSRSKREESPLTSSLRRPVPVHLKSAGVAVPQPLSPRSAHSVTRTKSCRSRTAASANSARSCTTPSPASRPVR